MVSQLQKEGNNLNLNIKNLTMSLEKRMWVIRSQLQAQDQFQDQWRNMDVEKEEEKA